MCAVQLLPEDTGNGVAVSSPFELQGWVTK
jgi:hypothetical protein